MDIRALKKLSPEELESLKAELPEEDLQALQDEMQEHELQQSARMQQLSMVVAEKRSEAIEFRRNSGIEEDWDGDEEYYEGIDDANRGESDAWNSKPPGREAVTTEDTGSTIFLNITRSYCDAAGASLADMLLPTDDSAWQIVPTPVPELIPFTKGELSEGVKADISAAMGGDPELVAETEAKMIDKAKAIIKEAKEKADKAQKRIEDWHVECQYHREVRKVIEDAARIGTGVIKGPVPIKTRRYAYLDGGLVLKEEIKPGSRRINYRNLYPAKGCGENIHDGSYIFERDDISVKKLRELKGVPGYFDDEINAVIDEGPTEASVKVKDVDEMKRDTSGLYEIWYYYGEITKDELIAAFDISNYDDDELDELGDVVDAQITMVNNRIIQVVLNPLDTGDFPYDVMVWQSRKNLPWGIGVARQIRTPQSMINGGARNLMDNAGMAGGPMWAVNLDLITPINGVVELVPRKGWELAEDAEVDDISKAFAYFNMDMMVEQLQAIIYFGLKMAEDVTGLPMIMQGQMGSHKIDTLGQTEILNNNANIVRRRIARLFDDLVTEPHVRRYYTHLLQYGEDDEKGEFVIDARGSSNLVERAIQKEKTLELLQMSQNPIYGLDPKKVATEYLRSEKYDPKNFEYDDEEWKQIVENMGQAAPDPREAIAQINAQIAQMREQGETQRAQMKMQSDQAMQENELNIKVALEQFAGNLEKEIAEMKVTGDMKMNTDSLKVSINETVQKLIAQQRLAGLKANPAPQVATPPTEPPGRAPNGYAYQQ